MLMHEGHFGKFGTQIEEETVKNGYIKIIVIIIVPKSLIKRGDSGISFIFTHLRKETRKFSIPIFERE